jgi:hypothetical protein
MTAWRRSLLRSLIEIASLLILHAILIRLMADRQIVSTILAANETIPRSTVAVAILFLVIRFLVVLALPGMILARIGLVLLGLLKKP